MSTPGDGFREHWRDRDGGGQGGPGLAPGPGRPGRRGGRAWQAPPNYIRTTGGGPGPGRLGELAAAILVILGLGVFVLRSCGPAAASPPALSTPTATLALCTGQGAASPLQAVTELTLTIQTDGQVPAALTDVLNCFDPIDRTIDEAALRSISGVSDYTFLGSLAPSGRPAPTSLPEQAIPGPYDLVRTTGTVTLCMVESRKRVCGPFAPTPGAAPGTLVTLRTAGAGYVFLGGGASSATASAAPGSPGRFNLCYPAPCPVKASPSPGGS